TPSPGTPGEGRGEGPRSGATEQSPHPDPLPEYRERGQEGAYRRRGQEEQEPEIHYAIAAAISSLPGDLLGEDEIALNEWAATRLRAKLGDQVRLDYYQRRADGELEEVRSDRAFRVKRILPMSGIGADRTLTPEYPGLTDKASIREAP